MPWRRSKSPASAQLFDIRRVSSLRVEYGLIALNCAQSCCLPGHAAAWKYMKRVCDTSWPRHLWVKTKTALILLTGAELEAKTIARCTVCMCACLRAFALTAPWRPLCGTAVLFWSASPQNREHPNTQWSIPFRPVSRYCALWAPGPVKLLTIDWKHDFSEWQILHRWATQHEPEANGIIPSTPRRVSETIFPHLTHVLSSMTGLWMKDRSNMPPYMEIPRMNRRMIHFLSTRMRKCCKLQHGIVAWSHSGIRQIFSALDYFEVETALESQLSA